MLDPERFETRRVGGMIQVARECGAPGCDFLVWPGDTFTESHLCPWHLQLLEGARRADEINGALLHEHAKMRDLIFWGDSQRRNYLDKILLPHLMAGGAKRNSSWDVRSLCERIS